MKVSKVYQAYFKEFSRAFQGRLRGIPRKFKGFPMEFQDSFKNILRNVQSCLKEVSSVFQENFKQKFHGCFKSVSMKFVLQFCSSMDLIAATRAEGGLVFTMFTKE